MRQTLNPSRRADKTEVLRAFAEAAAKAGIALRADQIVADGAKHRVDVIGKKGGQDASYLLHDDEYPAGGFQNFATGDGWQDWKFGKRVAVADDAEAKAEAERRQKAREAWDKAEPAPTDHPYLVAKEIEPHTARIYSGALKVGGISVDGALMIPMRSSEGFDGVQFITDDGEKRFYGRKQGRYCRMYGKSDAEDIVVIAEGFATGASVREATDYITYVAFDCGNLLSVARALRAAYPKAKLVFAADDDSRTDGNPGMTHAVAAALEVKGLVAMPQFGLRRGKKDTDFNDLARLRGAAQVEKQIDAARPPGDFPAFLPQNILRALTIDELTNEDFPEREYMLEPWLRTQSLSMIYAWRGAGKTFFSLSLAYAIATGLAFLDWSAPKRRKVLYIDGEMPGDELRGRLSRIRRMFGSPDDSYLRVITPDANSHTAMPDLATEDGQQQIELMIGDAELIVVDNISCLVRATRAENEAESWREVGTWALRQRQLGRSVLFIHHSNKTGAQRGTSKREDTLDNVIRLRRPKDYEAEQGLRVEVDFEKARGNAGDEIKAFEVRLEQHGSKIKWKWDALAESNRARMVELHKAGYKMKQIAKELGLHISNVSRGIAAAREDGEL